MNVLRWDHPGSDITDWKPSSLAFDSASNNPYPAKDGIPKAIRSLYILSLFSNYEIILSKAILIFSSSDAVGIGIGEQLRRMTFPEVS